MLLSSKWEERRSDGVWWDGGKGLGLGVTGIGVKWI